MSASLAPPRHAGRRVLVTGGASGIGAATVSRLRAEGARVAILDQLFPGPEPDRTTSTRAESTDPEPGSPQLRITADISCHDQVAEAYAQLEREWAGVDAVVNCAGISVRESCLKVTPESWGRVIAVNLTGAFIVAQHAALLMRRTAVTAGAIVVIASVSGMVGMPGYVAYNVSKAGVIEMVKTMALELAPQIRVNAICPGYVLTPMQRREYTDADIARCAAKLPMGRLGRPDEVAALASLLVSGEVEFATGQSFVIDGGETAGGLASQ